MLVSTKHKHLLVNARYPNKIMAVIPTAKSFQYQGRTLLAVPHKLDEVQVLNNLGLRAPSPMAYYYEWPGKYVPFEAQRVTGSFASIHRRAYILNDLGTGKTMSVLWAADWLMRIGAVKKALVMCPLSTMERTWGDEIFNSFPDRKASIVYGSAERRVKMLRDPDADFYVINHHGIKIKQVLAELQRRPDIDLIIIDELAVFRNSKSDLWKAANKIVKQRSWVWGMTGTPTPNAPTDAFGQCKLITPDSVPKYYGAFRDEVMRPDGPFGWKPRRDAMDRVYMAMQPAVRFSRDDCIDLPPCMYSTRTCPLSPEADKAYKEMKRELKTASEAGQVTAVNKAVMTSKLVQIACGVAYGKGGDEVLLPSPSRLDALFEIVEESTGKVIVFVPFTAPLDMIAGALGQAGIKAAVIDGRVGKSARDEIFRAFQQDHEPRVLVAQPAAMSHGLTLTEANTIVWYAPPTSNEIYQQANGRITRPGQKQNQFIIHLEGTPIERVMYKRLEERGSMQDVLLAAFRDS